jgi:NFU1 iron-sulfur cluster scaffold homolog, mitochondrial
MSNNTTEPLKISGELTHDPAMCHFHVNRPLVDGITMIFRGADESMGSPLIDKLFAVAGVEQVQVSGSTITVTKNVPMPWPHMASDIAKAIRDACTGAEPPLSESAVEAMRNLPMDGVEMAIAELFEEHINPALSSHGGYVRLVKVEGRDVYVEMGGGCQGCASSKATLRHGVESAIRRVAPQIGQVIDVTDHAAGVNPYYQ